MAKPYSQDLRDRVIDAVKKGEMSRRAAARRYEISKSVAIKWLERVERDGSRAPVGHGGHRASKTDAAPGLFGGRAGREIGRHASGPLRSPFGRARGQSRHLDDEPLLSPDRRHGRKKDPRRARAGSPRHRSPRKRWRTYQGLIDPRRLVFIDETWTKTNMTRLRGSKRTKGERLVDKVPHGRWKTATFLAALRNDRIEAPCLFDRPVDGERFHAYVEQFLVPRPSEAGRRRDPRQSRLPQGKGGAQGDPEISEPAWSFPAEILPRPQPPGAGLRQVQNSAAKGGSAKLRGDLRRLRQNPCPVPARRMRRIPGAMQDTRRPKSRTL